MNAILADGDDEKVLPIPAYYGAHVVVPVLSHTGRCECTKPAIQHRPFCRRRYTLKEMRGEMPVFRINARASAVKLTERWKP